MQKFTVLGPDVLSILSLFGSGFCFRSRGGVSLSWLFGLVQQVLLEGGLWHVSSFVGCFRSVLLLQQLHHVILLGNAFLLKGALLQELRHVILQGSVVLLVGVCHSIDIDLCAASMRGQKNGVVSVRVYVVPLISFNTNVFSN